jgi:hypothetical protein
MNKGERLDEDDVAVVLGIIGDMPDDLTIRQFETALPQTERGDGNWVLTEIAISWRLNETRLAHIASEHSLLRWPDQFSAEETEELVRSLFRRHFMASEVRGFPAQPAVTHHETMPLASAPLQAARQFIDGYRAEFQSAASEAARIWFAEGSADDEWSAMWESADRQRLNYRSSSRRWDS